MHPEFDSEKFSENAADFCRRLLDKNEATRLGFNGCNEIMSHLWFRDVNWEEIISDRMKPPYIPPKDVNAASQSEIGTFAEAVRMRRIFVGGCLIRMRQHGLVSMDATKLCPTCGFAM